MGGRSRSSNTQQTRSSQSSQVNDGDLAGASNFSIDESRTEIDQDIDNSQRNDSSTRTEFNQDIDKSQRSDSSQRTENDIDNSMQLDQETDNSINNDGDFAGASNVTILDGGAIDGAFDFARDIDKQNREFLENGLETISANANTAILSNSRLSSDAIDFAGDAIGQNALLSRSAIEEVSANASDNLAFTNSFSSEALQGLGDNFDNTLALVADLSDSTSTNAINGLNASLRSVTELAKSTTSGGETVVAQTSENIIKYIAIAAAVIAGAVVLRG